MSNLYNVVGTSTPNQLLADPQGADVIAVNVKPGSGTVKRGTILYRESSGLYSPAATANIVSTNQLVVLNEEVVTPATPAAGKSATAVDAAAYRAGRFIDGKVKLASDAAVTEAHKIVLRQQGILFIEMESTGTFTNTVTTPAASEG